MNLFSQSRPKPNLAALQQIKTWVYDLLKLDPDIGISVSQLQCKEPDCPPIETVITILSQPAQQYKIHKALDDIELDDLIRLFQTE
ncbi:hypothetical protein D0962_02590 [Leptolyngbyaceae cyanobacterium CCMR0082]|uniref:Nitrate reductase n=1 Tax=Adonisia turfae CCMR0082 TaxID=2304604 RepID=A0A6M0RZP2_9CYAN|nr:hypothetical protein [Adonisia turfae]MDV3352191.1 hypothetical protein [Leptothoe sp. LEGE 181152]NEZ61674.1 hypothetical protein [Adonisia turfae CCMR0082]